VLHDDGGRLVKLLHQFPTGVEIDEVVEAQFLALQLASAGDAEACAIGVKRGALVRIFAGNGAIAASGKLMRRVAGSAVESKTAGASGAGASLIWSRVLAMAVSYAAVSAKGLPRQPPARGAAQTAVGAFHFFNESRVIRHASHDGTSSSFWPPSAPSTGRQCQYFR